MINGEAQGIAFDAEALKAEADKAADMLQCAGIWRRLCGQRGWQHPDRSTSTTGLALRHAVMRLPSYSNKNDTRIKIKKDESGI